MNTLTDLRTTLGEHAEAVRDAEVTVRLAAVHHRVADVRRRRRAVGTGAVALALLAGVAAVAVPRVTNDAQPAAPVLLGDRAPTTEKALGYTYRTDGKGTSFLLSGSLDVPKSDEPRLYSWTTSMNTRISLRLPNNEVWHSDESDFRDYVVVPPGNGGTIEVSAEHGSVGIASYRLTDAIPVGGYSKDGITFRNEVAGTSLVRGFVTDEGQTDAATSYVVPPGRVALHLVCSGIPRGDSVHVSIDGRPATVAEPGSCDAADDFDPASSNTYTMPARGKPGTRVPVRVWLANSSDVGDTTALAAGSAPDLRVGLGVYGVPNPITFDRARVEQYVERGGHTFRFVTGRWRNHGRHLLLGPALVDRAAEVVFRTPGSTLIRYRAGAFHTTGRFGGGGYQGFGGLFAPAGADVRVHLVEGTGAFGIALYERTD
jgi:hypothetical protein